MLTTSLAGLNTKTDLKETPTITPIMTILVTTSLTSLISAHSIRDITPRQTILSPTQETTTQAVITIVILSLTILPVR